MYIICCPIIFWDDVQRIYCWEEKQEQEVEYDNDDVDCRWIEWVVGLIKILSLSCICGTSFFFSICRYIIFLPMQQHSVLIQLLFIIPYCALELESEKLRSILMLHTHVPVYMKRSSYKIIYFIYTYNDVIFWD